MGRAKARSTHGDDVVNVNQGSDHVEHGLVLLIR